MKSKYTFEYNQTVEELLDNTLASIANDVKKSAECTHIKYLVLGGGYGRGEGGILFDNGSAKPYNDLDFFVISDTAEQSANSQIDAFLKTLSEKYTRLIGIDVDFGAARSVEYVAERTSILMWLEMVLGANIVVGDEKKFHEEIKPSTKLPPVEFAKLMFNRCSGLLYARRRLEQNNLQKNDCDFIARNINKAIMACSDAFLASREIYRFHSIDRLVALEAQNVPNEISQIKKYYAQALEFKKYPTLNQSQDTLLKKHAEVVNLCIGTINLLEKFFNVSEKRGIVKMMVNFRNNMKVRKYFAKMGYANPMFESPILAALEVVKNMLCTQKICDEDMNNFVEIWNRIN